MHRRGQRSALVALVVRLAAALALAITLVGGGATVRAEPEPEPRPPVTIDDQFLPESANLSDCIGLVERPGCGAEGRGGTAQTLTFLALAAGLGLIFWRVSVGVRRNRAAQNAAPRTDRPSNADTPPNPSEPPRPTESP